MRKYLIILAATIASVGCSNQSDEATPKGGYGTLSVACTTDNNLTIAPQAVTPPAGEDFKLRIQSSVLSFDESWAKVSDLTQDLKFQAGTYTATVESGNIDEEGYDKPYYKGEKEFQIVARQLTEVSMTATLHNTKVVVECTDAFRAYFHDIDFTLTTAAANSFKYQYNWTSVSDRPDTDATPIYIKPAQFKIAGSAVKQTGVKITFDEKAFSTVNKQTQYTVRFDLSGAGAATLTILVNDTPIEQTTISEELNDDSVA